MIFLSFFFFAKIKILEIFFEDGPKSPRVLEGTRRKREGEDAPRQHQQDEMLLMDQLP